MRGRKPKPTALKIAEGNRGKRPIKDDEPKPEVGDAACPVYLKGMARQRWDDIVPQLVKLGIFTSVDMAAMVRLCQAWALWRKALRKVKEGGEVILTDKNNLVQNPWLGIANKQNEIMRRLESEFGLTPSSRTRLSVGDGKGKPADELNDFLSDRPAVRLAE